MFSKSKIINLIDLTFLNDNDPKINIKNLIKKYNTNLGRVAAICIYKEYIEYAKSINKNLRIATVINFPTGSNSIKNTLLELEYAINKNADEIDLVIPYRLIIGGETKSTEKMISQVRKNCKNKILKTIIESGELKKETLIRTASKIAIDEGTDFIKTSTGKVKINATLEAAKFILEEIKDNNQKCGFKAAGGITTYEEAIAYLNLAKKIMEDNFINPNTFRFGASSLLDNLLMK